MDPQINRNPCRDKMAPKNSMWYPPRFAPKLDLGAQTDFGMHCCRLLVSSFLVSLYLITPSTMFVDFLVFYCVFRSEAAQSL